MSTPRKPDLDRLVTALTADGRPDELAGREAAAAAFRAAGRRDAADGPARPRRVSAAPAARHAAASGWPPSPPSRSSPRGSPRRPTRGRCPARCRNSRTPCSRRSASPTTSQPAQPGHPAAVTIATSGGKSGRATPAGKAKTPSPRPGAGYLLTVTASRARVPAGETVAFTGRVTDYGRAAAGVRVRLFERLAGFRSVAARGHRGDRAARRVQAAEPAADEDRGLPGGRARRRAQRGGAGRGRRP